jgi:hypothetical protein
MDPKNLLSRTSQDKNKRSVKYITKDFAGFRDNLIKYLKSYFPETINDFHPASSGMMLIELNAYVGDVLSFYLDQSFKEVFLDTAVEKKNILNRAKFLGYKPTLKSPSTTYVDVYCVVPSILSNSLYVADTQYALYIGAGMQLSAENSTKFETMESVDFSDNFHSNREDVIYEYSAGVPSKFIMKKTAQVVAGETKSFTYSVSDPQEYLRIKIPDSNVTDIISVVDSENNKWHEVDYLAQDTIYYETKNTDQTNVEYYQHKEYVPYILRLIRTNKRFTKEIDHLGNVFIRFGAGTSYNMDDEIISNPYSVSIPISGASFTNTVIDPNNYLKTKTLGEAPYNTTFTISYRIGGGTSTNVGSNTINKIEKINVSLSEPNNSLNQASIRQAIQSIAVNNPLPANGGSDFESTDKIRNIASSYFAAQNRVVTKEDYIARVLSMPAKYGKISKVYASPSFLQQGDITKKWNDVNQFGVNLYVLSKDSNNRLTQATNALKNNLKTYLSKYRILTDGINILDGEIINIRIKFRIVALPQYNKNYVLIKCISNIADYFNIDNIEFNQQIVISEIYYILQSIEGVQAVKSVEIENIYGGNYSNCVYDINANTKNGIVYPSRELSIFEIKYPENDIKGTVE